MYIAYLPRLPNGALPSQKTEELVGAARIRQHPYATTGWGWKGKGKGKGKDGLTHYFTQHLRSVVVSDQINREFGGVVERPLEWMAWLRSGLGIAFEVDPCDLDEITGLVGFEVDHAWDCESAWLGGLGVEVDDVAVWIEEGEAALISLVV